MSAVPFEPRPLNASEHAVLEHILSAGFVGAAALRGQLDRTEVVATWGAGSASVDLRVRGLVRHPAPASVPLPVDALVHDRAGEYIGELLVWAEGGTTLSALEYAWVTDEMPGSLPSVDQIQRTAQ
ncbi:hypothetical protein [Streptomyces yaizuensis]|uniref:Uncharacterized protein n=1 Tax=Streptomyces yaizuensis TaxID=2989713 RepID=A0ABQ5P6B4_9ACTN|nr:hypothetical protein [Streptomyces sp. YSPA8]GLF98030.1 hypothetical protein SYYSPA8_27055 [Streptomyces sp. YSPA8]